MINKQVLAQLRTKLKVGEQQTYKAIQQKKKEYGNLVTTETAAYILASDSGIDISKYLDKNELAETREAKKGHGGPVAPMRTAKVAKAEKKASRQVTIDIGKALKLTNGFLTDKIAEEAKKMAEQVYPVVYLFENSIRNLISKRMLEMYGSGWWDTQVSGTIKRNVQGRIDAENSDRWHSKRGAHQIYYTDMGDLSSIITTNWDVFKPIFPDQGWVTQRLDEVEKSRNIIAHNNPLEQKEIDRINLYFDDWNRQLSGIKDEEQRK